MDIDPKKYPSKFQIETVSETFTAIGACSQLANEIIVERNNDDRPKWCDSDYTLCGLIRAIDLLSKSMDHFLESEYDKAKIRHEQNDNAWAEYYEKNLNKDVS